MGQDNGRPQGALDSRAHAGVRDFEASWNAGA